MKKTLLNVALTNPRKSRSPFPEEELIALSVAFLTGRINFAAASKALDRTGNNVYSLMLTALRRAYVQGKIKII